MKDVQIEQMIEKEAQRQLLNIELIASENYVSDDVLEKYKDHLIYSTDDGESESYPCAIELTDNQWIQKYGIYDSCYFGVFSRSEQKDYYTKFADFLLNY